MMKFEKACELAEASNNHIVAGTFRSYWGGKDIPIKAIDDKAFIAVASREFNNKVYNKVYYIVTDPKHKRQGLATKLLIAVPEPALYVVEQNNVASIALAKQCGFEVVTTIPSEFGIDVYLTKESVVKSIKQDAGKLRYDLLPWEAMDDIASVMTMGADKYGDYSWYKNSTRKDLHRYEAALARHLSAHMQGKYLDSESGLPHMSHIACNAMFITSLLNKFSEEDDG